MADSTWPKDQTVFFTNVPYETTLSYLKKVFSRAGGVKEVELFTGKNGSIGAGLVLFNSPEAASSAIEELDGTDVDGREMVVKASDRDNVGRPGRGGAPECTVFFNGASWDTTEGYLRSHFEKHGEIVDFDFWRNPNGSSLGMGTCAYKDEDSVAAAIEGLNGVVIDGRYLVVQEDKRPEDSIGPSSRSGKGGKAGTQKGKGKGWGKDSGGKGGKKGDSKGGKNSSKGDPKRTVFWSNVSKETGEGYLRRKFESVGTIIDFDFWRRDGYSVGKGICEYDHHLGAWRAVEQLHGMVIDGKTLLVKMDEGRKEGK